MGENQNKVQNGMLGDAAGRKIIILFTSLPHLIRCAKGFRLTFMPYKNVIISIKVNVKGNVRETIISIVDADSTEYRRKIDTRIVRRNVALPSWLDYEANKAGVNVSRILQEALIGTLKLERRM